MILMYCQTCIEVSCFSGGVYLYLYLGLYCVNQLRIPSISGLILLTLSVFSLDLIVDQNLTVCCQNLADLYTY
jgi:hypothetical protein